MKKLYFFFLLVSSSIFAQDLSTITKQKPFVLSGSLGANSTFYAADGVANRQKPFTWNTFGNLTATVYGVAIPISFVVTEQQRTYTQPLNQFGMSPTYKWAKFHLGYRNLTFTPFTLSGNTFLGAAVELNPKNVRFSALVGRFQKAINEDTSSLSSVSPMYQRMGYAFRVGFGDKQNYIDAIYLNATDDVNSLSHIPTRSEVLPQDNSILGFSGKAKLFQKFLLDADFANSNYRRNTLTEEAAITRNAISAGITYKLSKLSLRLQYKRIDPEYKSLMVTYINTDLQEFTFMPTASLFKSKLNLQASVGSQNDNLRNEKIATTNRLIYSVNASFQPTQRFGIDVLFSNYGISQSKGIKALNDTIKISQTLSNFTINNRYIIAKEKSVQTFVLTGIAQVTNDANQFTQKFTENRSQIANFTYSYNPLQTGWMMNASAMYTTTDLSAINFSTYGATLGTGKEFFKKKIQFKTSLSYFINELNHQSSGITLNENLTLVFKPTKKHTFTIVANYFDRYDKTGKSISFKEYRIFVGYVYIF